MSGWLLLGSLAALFGLGLFLLLCRHVWRMIQRTKARRPSPSRTEFVASLARDVRPETAEFLWERMDFLQPTVAPHPDDHLWHDLPIDESEPMTDWLVDFAHRHGASAQDWPSWPAGSPCTVRNYARWLERGLRA